MSVVKTKEVLKKIIPKSILGVMGCVLDECLRLKYRKFGRPRRMGETAKARNRRVREGFFSKYCRGRGIDIGYGGDLITPECRGWDWEDGNAQYVKGLRDSEFDFVYSSHTLEHMPNPGVALRNWWRVLKPGGYLILYIPSRDLYEKRTRLPSRWNENHNYFFLLGKDERPDTIDIIQLINQTFDNCEMIEAKECNEGHVIIDPEIHSDGEYSIEIVLKKMN